MTALELLRSDSFGLLPAPAGRLFGSAQVLTQTADVDADQADAS